MDTSPEITAQLQHILTPIIKITLENKTIGTSCGLDWLSFTHLLLDVLDHALDLVDSLTFNTKTIPPEMWPIFEEIYKLFKNGVVDFLDGELPDQE